MYLRKSKKPNGRTYLTIVQGYRDEDGKNRARTVKSLGYVDALEAEFGDPVAHFGEECRRMTAEAARAEGRVELGAAVPSAYLHRDLGIWSFFERSRRERERVVEKSRAAVARGDMSSAAAKTPVRYARDAPVVRETGEAADHNWVIDEERIAADEAMDGYYCIVTSEQDMDDREAIDAYRGLWRIEESFRVMKGDLGARPVYCSTESHIRAHFLVCYVALLAMRLMQLDTGRKYSAAQISEALAGVTGHLVDHNLYLFDHRTDLTDELAGAVGIDLSRQVLTRAQIRSIMADVKKPRN